MNGFIREQVIKRLSRSSGWRKVRNLALERAGKKCECCGRRRNLQVHHIEDFSTHPEKELDPGNLIVLCGRCHLLIGHLNYWKSINSDVAEDSKYLHVKIQNRRN